MELFGSLVKIHRYPVTVIGKILPLSATGKLGRLAGELLAILVNRPLSQETLVCTGLFKDLYHFFKVSEIKPKKTSCVLQNFQPLAFLREGVFMSYPGLFTKIFFVFVIVAALTGCSEPVEDPVSLNGSWASEFDEYIIDLDGETLEYDGGYGFYYSGNILDINYFDTSRTAGIIFIEYKTKPIDFDTGKEPDGDYIGIYFRYLTSTAGAFASPAEIDKDGKYVTPAKESLEEAKKSFTKDNVGDYVSFWSVCRKQ